MKHIHSVYETERMFLRSCLESAPRHDAIRSFNLYQPLQKSGPAGLHTLKQRLLRAAMEQITDAEIQKQLCGAANVAAELVWDTNSPALLFPCLFEEMMAQVMRQVGQGEITLPPDDFTFEAEQNDHENNDFNPEDASLHPILTDEGQPAALSMVEV